MGYTIAELEIASGVADALNYQAPFVEARLLNERVVDTAEEARALFTEAKRYLVLCRIDDSKVWPVCSQRVDEAWHQFILFTTEYTAFCKKYFGEYVHHSPCNVDHSFLGNSNDATFAEFGDRYRELFGMELPDVWYDSTAVRPHRRVVNEQCGRLKVDAANGKVVLFCPQGRALLRVNAIASEALQFIANTAVFHVRELPGDLTNDEKVRLVSTVIDVGVLRPL